MEAIGLGIDIFPLGAVDLPSRPPESNFVIDPVTAVNGNKLPYLYSAGETMHGSSLLIEHSCSALSDLRFAIGAIALSVRHGIRAKEQSYKRK